MKRVIQMKFVLDFSENTYSIIHNQQLNKFVRAFDLNYKFSSFRMIYDVIDHFRKAILANFNHVGRHIFHYRAASTKWVTCRCTACREIPNCSAVKIVISAG